MQYYIVKKGDTIDSILNKNDLSFVIDFIRIVFKSLIIVERKYPKIFPSSSSMIKQRFDVIEVYKLWQIIDV